MTPPDIVERLRTTKWCPPLCDCDDIGKSCAMVEAAAEIEQLREEVETWRDAYEAEHQDHEATMKAWDAERSGM